MELKPLPILVYAEIMTPCSLLPTMSVFLKKLREKIVVIADPMLATGGTSIEALERLLKESQVAHVKVYFLAMFAAPEGVLRLLHKYPNATVVTGSIDDYINKSGYIVLGLGDFGDKFTFGLNARQLCKIWDRCLTEKDAIALTARTREIVREKNSHRKR